MLNQDAVELRKELGFNISAHIDLLNVVLEEFPDITIIFHPFQKIQVKFVLIKTNIQIYNSVVRCSYNVFFNNSNTEPYIQLVNEILILPHIECWFFIGKIMFCDCVFW